MWKILYLFTLLSSCHLRTGTAESYIDNVIEEQHKLINEMNQNFTDLEKASEKLINLGTFIGSHKVPPKTVKITNTVAVKVPVPYPVKIPHPVPVPVPVTKAIPVPVTKLIKVPEPSPTPTASSYATTPEAIPTAVALTSRSLGPTGVSHLLEGEQDTAHSNNNEQVEEFVRSLPVHSVYDVGSDYNPYMGNRLAVSKQVGSASEVKPAKYRESELQQWQEYRDSRQKYESEKHHYAGYRSTTKEYATASPSQAYHEYAYSNGQSEATPSSGHNFHPEVIPNSYKSPTKSTYFSKDYEKYPTPKFPRPTSSAFPTNPTYSTKEVNYEDDEHRYGEHDYKSHHQQASPTAVAFQTVRDSYPRYEKPNLQHYQYEKPTAESYRNGFERESASESRPQKSQKYLEHYQKPTAISYASKYHDEEHKEVAEPSAHYKHYEQHSESYQTHDETYPEHRSPSDHYDSPDLYAKPSATPEAYSQYESNDPQYTPQEYKTYYAKPTPVSEALTYLEDKEPSHHTEHVVHVKPLNYHYETQNEHKSQYPSKSNAIPYNFPSDSHLHPSYSESAPGKHKPQHYYPSNQDHSSFDEESKPEHKYYHHPHYHQNPSPSPSTHITSYDHAEASGNEYHHLHHQQQQQQHHNRQQYNRPPYHHREATHDADMLESSSSSRDHEAYERAVEQDHRAAHPNEYAEYSHEHMHHHHPADDGREDGGRDY
ncbi:LIM domain-containing protein A isoform X1 [Aedes albopictus]|uniref:Uncharacterized protein n=2 Tax=Aedes albopictus TaxID=7160 RepID=A0ABM1ZC32_AEDAL